MSVQVESGPVSLYQVLREQLGDDLAPIRFTKTTLIQLSHTLEDIIITQQLPALVLVGFQESRHWQEELPRYEAIARYARQVCVFAVKPLTANSLQPNITQIGLEQDDPLSQEWFLLILCQEFSVMLCALDTNLPAQEDEERQFDTLWSFEPTVVTLALDILTQIIARHCPITQNNILTAYQDYLPVQVNIALVSQLTIELLRFEERLNQRLHESFNQIAASEERFKQVITSIPYQVYMLEVDETDANDILFMYLSPNFAELTGYPINLLADLTNFWANRLVHPDDRNIGRAQFDRLRHGIDSTVEYRIIRASGEEVWVQDSARTLPGKTPGKRQVYGIINDITTRRRLDEALLNEEKLRLELNQERELNALKNSLMTTLSHEFRTPLAAILSASELIERYRDRLSDEDYTRRLGIIREQIQHLGSMLDDINKVINTSTTRLNFIPIPDDLYRIVEETIEIIRHARNSTHDFSLSVQGEQRLIPMDQKLMRQVVVNLLDNAVKYSPGGGQIHVQLNYEADRVLLEISDNGIGIPVTDQPLIFEPFHRANNVGTINGTGLGLKIVRDYLDLHHGRITYRSVEGQGTTFTIMLPG